MKVEVEFKLQDFWIGVFWKMTERDSKELVYSQKHNGNIYVPEKFLDIWICLIPCLPIHIRKYYIPII